MYNGLPIEVKRTGGIADGLLATFRVSKRDKAYTILPKFEKGVPNVACGDRRGMSSMFGRPPPRPALLGPPPDGPPPMISLTFSFGAARRAARPPSGPGGRPGAEGADCAERSIGCSGLSPRDMFWKAFAVASSPEPACPRAAI